MWPPLWDQYTIIPYVPRVGGVTELKQPLGEFVGVDSFSILMLLLDKNFLITAEL